MRVNPKVVLRKQISKEAWDAYKLSRYVEYNPPLRKNFSYMEKTFYLNDIPVICSHFGCGKTLNDQEKRFGLFCVTHQKPIPYTSLIDPYLYE
jgi:hypothetical protein